MTTCARVDCEHTFEKIRPNQRYCSLPCKRREQKRRIQARRPVLPAQSCALEGCTQEFRPHRRNIHQKFCSEKCRRRFKYFRTYSSKEPNDRPLGKSFLPSAPVMSVVRAWLEREEKKPRGRLQQQAKIVPRQLYMHLNEKAKWMSFDLADRLICAIGDPGAWHREPLAEFYLTDYLCLDGLERKTDEKA